MSKASQRTLRTPIGSYLVELRSPVAAGEPIQANIVPVPDVPKLLAKTEMRLADGVLDIFSQLIAELALTEVDDGGTDIVE